MGRQFSRDSESYTEARSAHADRVQRDLLTKKKIEGFVALGLAVVGAAVFGGSFVYNGSVNNVISQELEPEIAVLQQTLNQKQNDTGVNAAGKTVKYVDAVVSSASEAGLRVCQLQNELGKNKYKSLVTGLSTNDEQLMTQLTEFRSYFPSGSLKGDLKGAWCAFGTWTFKDSFDFEGTNMNVAWCCYNDDGKLLAVCVATYLGDSNSFANPVLYRTEVYMEEERALPLVQPVFTTTSQTLPDYTLPDSTLPDYTSPDTTLPDYTLPDYTLPDYTLPDDTTRVDSQVVSDTIVSSDTDVSEDTTVSTTESSVETTTVTTVIYGDFDTTVPYEYPEEMWFYGWSVEYQCWGYFDQDGNFLTENEYQQMFGW